MPEPLDLEALNLDLNLNDQTNHNSQEFSDFAQGVLKNIPEEDREIVGKYLKDWDGNVTKRFQSIHEEYKPYTELGPLDDVRGALDWVKLINDDPVDFYNKFTALLKEAELMPQEFDNEEGEVTSKVSPEIMREMQEMRQELTGLRETVSERSAREEYDSQQRQLDDLLQNMHNSLGDFNDDFVVMQLAKGDCTPQEAVERFNSVVKDFNTRKPPPPNLFTKGSGSVPQDEQVNLSKMDKKDKLAMMVQALELAKDQ